jgi:uncharacterized circularly permuted ATP-grasp superfamily protein
MSKTPAMEVDTPHLDPITALADDYRTLPGVADEMLDGHGNIRPVWQNFVNAINKMGQDELHERFARADRYLRDAGVFYRLWVSRQQQ